MDRQGFRAMLRERKVPAEKLDSALALAERFEQFAQEEGGFSADTAWEIWVVNLDGSNPHKVVGTVGNDPNNSTYIAAWKQGKFLIGGYQGHWDPYFVAETGGEPNRLPASEKDDKPTDWWLP